MDPLWITVSGVYQVLNKYLCFYFCFIIVLFFKIVQCCLSLPEIDDYSYKYVHSHYYMTWTFWLWSESVKSLSHVQCFVTPWTVAHQALQSMEFSRQDYWSGQPFPFPGDLPNPGIKPGYPALQADSLLSKPLGKPGLCNYILVKACE